MRIKHLLLLLLFISWQNALSQANTSYTQVSDAVFQSEAIDSLNFKPFQGSVNEGLNLGWYCIKIENIEEPSIVSIPSNRIQDISCYQSDKRIQQNQNAQYNSFELHENKTAYLMIHCEREAFIPIKLTEKTSYASRYQKQILVQGLYYGLAIMIFILNFFYYFRFNDITFLYYSLFLLSVSGTIFVEDGLLHLFSHNKKLKLSIELISQFGSALFGFLFASAYLQIEKYFPKLKYATYLVICIGALGYLMFGFSENYLYLFTGKASVTVVLVTYWLIGIPIIRENKFVIYTVLGYSLMVFSGVCFFINPMLGLKTLSIETLKIGGVFEMLLLSYAVVHRISILDNINKQMKDDLYRYIHEVDTLKAELSELNLKREKEIHKANLNERETAILKMISEGKTNKEMAKDLYISTHAIKYHIQNLYRKLEIKSRKEAKLKSIDLELISNH